MITKMECYLWYKKLFDSRLFSQYFQSQNTVDVLQLLNYFARENFTVFHKPTGVEIAKRKALILKGIRATENEVV